MNSSSLISERVVKDLGSIYHFNTVQDLNCAEVSSFNTKELRSVKV